MQRKTLTILIACSTFVLPAIALGQMEYAPLAPIPVYGLNSQNIDIGTYVKGIFQLLIALTVLLSVGAIMVGGFQYITSDSYSNKSEGKHTIIQALQGLLLAIVSYLILYTINPGLLGFSFDRSFKAVGSPPGTSQPGDIEPPPPPPGGPGTLTHAQAASQLAQNGFSISSSGNCSDQNSTNCTSLNGLRQETIDGVIALKQSCSSIYPSCAHLTITGGTEKGHTDAHSQGYKVDIRTGDEGGVALTAYLNEQIPGWTLNNNENYVVNIGGNSYIARFEGDHWDIQVK